MSTTGKRIIAAAKEARILADHCNVVTLPIADEAGRTVTITNYGEHPLTVVGHGDLRAGETLTIEPVKAGVEMNTAKEDRRRELHLQIDALRKEYQRKVDPLVKELADIAATEPPPPVVLPDGRVMQYVGPLPEWKEKPFPEVPREILPKGWRK